MCFLKEKVKVRIRNSDINPTHKYVRIDSCIAPIIEALQTNNIGTEACCCGHKGERLGYIDLKDGRTLVILENDNAKEFRRSNSLKKINECKNKMINEKIKSKISRYSKWTEEEAEQIDKLSGLTSYEKKDDVFNREWTNGYKSLEKGKKVGYIIYYYKYSNKYGYEIKNTKTFDMFQKALDEFNK